MGRALDDLPRPERFADGECARCFLANAFMYVDAEVRSSDLAARLAFPGIAEQGDGDLVVVNNTGALRSEAPLPSGSTWLHCCFCMQESDARSLCVLLLGVDGVDVFGNLDAERRRCFTGTTAQTLPTLVASYMDPIACLICLCCRGHYMYVSTVNVSHKTC